MLPSGDFETDMRTLLKATDSGVVGSYMKTYEDGNKELMVKKVDVLRLAAYLRTHR